jgi:hypothetical protein
MIVTDERGNQLSQAVRSILRREDDLPPGSLGSVSSNQGNVDRQQPAVVPAEPYLNYHNVPRHPKEALSASSSRNGGQGKPLRIPLPLPRTLAASDPAKVVSLAITWSSPSAWPTDFGRACGCWRSDRGDGDGKAPGFSGPF